MGNEAGIAIFDTGINKEIAEKYKKNKNYIFSLLNLKENVDYKKTDNKKIQGSGDFSREHGTGVLSAFALKSPNVLKAYNLDQQITVHDYPSEYYEIIEGPPAAVDILSYYETAIIGCFSDILKNKSVNVINISAGFPALSDINLDENFDLSKTADYLSEFNKSSDRIRAKLNELNNENVIIIQAAGNYDVDSYDVNTNFFGLINQHDQTILVGGFNNDRQYFSLITPGSKILVSDVLAKNQLDGSDEVIYDNGETSQASPTVAFFTYILKKFNPEFSKQDIEEILVYGADPLPHDHQSKSLFKFEEYLNFEFKNVKKLNDGLNKLIEQRKNSALDKLNMSPLAFNHMQGLGYYPDFDLSLKSMIHLGRSWPKKINSKNLRKIIVHKKVENWNGDTIAFNCEKYGKIKSANFSVSSDKLLRSEIEELHVTSPHKTQSMPILYPASNAFFSDIAIAGGKDYKKLNSFNDYFTRKPFKNDKNYSVHFLNEPTKSKSSNTWMVDIVAPSYVSKIKNDTNASTSLSLTAEFLVEPEDIENNTNYVIRRGFEKKKEKNFDLHDHDNGIDVLNAADYYLYNVTQENLKPKFTCEISLIPGTKSVFHYLSSNNKLNSKNITITKNTQIENAIDGPDNGKLIGNNLDNVLEGWEGNDHFIPMSGFDYVKAGLGNDKTFFHLEDEKGICFIEDDKVNPGEVIFDRITDLNKIKYAILGGNNIAIKYKERYVVFNIKTTCSLTFHFPGKVLNINTSDKKFKKTNPTKEPLKIKLFNQYTGKTAIDQKLIFDNKDKFTNLFTS